MPDKKTFSIIKNIVRVVILCTLVSCSSQSINNNVSAETSKAFKSYWYRGAEITSYKLEQMRYGEARSGNAVLVFVTENFSSDKQVKSDDPNSQKVIPILKLNFVKKFVTGIYSYSIMNSVFTPVNVKAHPQTLKVSFSSQEWCGNMYSQMNLRDGNYSVSSHSYFEKEADRNFELDGAFLEDEVWTRIRIAPETLPLGSVKMILGSVVSRLHHIKQDAREAQTVLETDNGVSKYTIKYSDLRRKLTINFKKDFPHEILSWEESYKGKVSRAVKTKTMIVDYWNKKTNADMRLREKLGLKK